MSRTPLEQAGHLSKMQNDIKVSSKKIIGENKSGNRNIKFLTFIVRSARHAI
jgi:hypothetical protein